MTGSLARCSFRRVTPKDELANDPERAQVLESARLAVRTAHEIASPPLVAALGYLATLSDNSLLPLDLRYKAKEAALRVAEAAVHLDCLPEVFNDEAAWSSVAVAPDREQRSRKLRGSYRRR